MALNKLGSGSWKALQVPKTSDDTPTETPIPSPYRRCSAHDEFRSELQNEFKDTRDRIVQVGGNLAELSGHVAVLSANITKIGEKVSDLDKKLDNTTATANRHEGKITSLLTMVGIAFGALGGGLAAGLTLARFLAAVL